MPRKTPTSASASLAPPGAPSPRDEKSQRGRTIPVVVARRVRTPLVLAGIPRNTGQLERSAEQVARGVWVKRPTLAVLALGLAAALSLPVDASAQELRLDRAATSADTDRVAPTWDGAWLAATLRDAAQHADRVLAGEVVRIEAFPSGPQGQPGIHTRVTLLTDPSLLGVTDTDSPDSREEVDFWMPGGRLGNRIRLLTGQVRFELGEVVAVLLYTTDHGTLWPASLARSKWRFDGRHVALPTAQGRLTLDRFRALVDAIYRSGP